MIYFTCITHVLHITECTANTIPNLHFISTKSELHDVVLGVSVGFSVAVYFPPRVIAVNITATPRTCKNNWVTLVRYDASRAKHLATWRISRARIYRNKSFMCTNVCRLLEISDDEWCDQVMIHIESLYSGACGLWYRGETKSWIKKSVWFCFTSHQIVRSV